MELIEGDTRSLEYGSYKLLTLSALCATMWVSSCTHLRLNLVSHPLIINDHKDISNQVFLLIFLVYHYYWVKA